MRKEFRDLKQADKDFVGNAREEEMIKQLVKKIDGDQVLQIEKTNQQKQMLDLLESYSQEDFLNENNYKIIIEVRELKLMIKDTQLKLEVPTKSLIEL